MALAVVACSDGLRSNDREQLVWPWPDALDKKRPKQKLVRGPRSNKPKERMPRLKSAFITRATTRQLRLGKASEPVK